MFVSRTTFNLKPPFRSELSEELVRLYRYFLGDPIEGEVIKTRLSILSPGTVIIELPMYGGSHTLRPVEEVLEERNRKEVSKRRQCLIAQKLKK